MNLSLSSRLHVPTLRNSFQALAPRGGRTLAMQSATQTGSMLLAEHVRPSQESAEDSAAGKKARTGPSPASEDEDDDDDPRLTASVKAVLLKCLPAEIDRITPIIARTLNLDFERSMEFTRAPCKEEIAKVRQACEEKVAQEEAKVQQACAEVQGLRAQVVQHAKRSAQLTAQVQLLEHRSGATEVALDVQDQTARRNNLVVGKLREGEEGADPRGFAATLLQIPLPAVLEAKRLGAPRASGARPRDLLVIMTDSATRATAFKQGVALRRRQVYLDVHLTPSQRQARHEKQERYLALRTQGCKPHWRGSTIMYYTS